MSFGGSEKQFCTNCMFPQFKEGGTWKIVRNGMYRRWLCAKCTVKDNERKERERCNALNATTAKQQ